MKDDIHDIVNRVVQEQQENRHERQISDFIDQVVGSDLTSMLDVVMSNRAKNISDDIVKEEVQLFILKNASEISFKWREALRIMLRQELLGEK